MTRKKKTPDTEPDDAFSLILGDVNASPMNPLAAPEPALRHGAAHPMPGLSSELKAPLAPDAAILAPLQPTPPPAQHKDLGHPWLEVVLDTCTITPDCDISGAPGSSGEAPESLRQALLAAARADTKVIRLDLAGGKCSTDCLAVALAFARMLSKQDDSQRSRLVLSNCAPAFKVFLETVAAPQTHGISLS